MIIHWPPPIIPINNTNIKAIADMFNKIERNNFGSIVLAE